LLFGALSVLLVACTNIATLLLVRGMRDQRVTALRAALGASRARLIREVLARSIVLSVFGGVAGIGVAYAGARLILSLAFAGRDAWIPIAPTPSLPVLLFALALTLVTSIVFGVAPAILAARVDPITLLRGGARSIGARRALSQKGLVAAQVALSVTLVSVAAMLGQSLRNLERQNFGFATDGRYLISIDSKVSNRAADQLDPMFRDIESRLRTIPGVRAASPVLYAPLSGYYWSHSIRIEGQPEPASDDRYTTAWTRVTLNFFETLGDKILMGRAFTDGDDAGARPVAVISQTFARKYFGNENPIGRHFGPAPRVNSARYEIVGVAADVQFFSGVDGDERPMYFVLEAQQTHFDDAELQSREVWSHYLYSIVVWAPGNPPGLEASVKGVLAAVDPNLVVYNVRSYTQVVHAQFAQQSLIASLASLFGIVTLILAAIGLYGVTAYNVEQRTSELGVRMALGAQQRSVVAMVLRGAMQPATVGLFVGIPAAVLVGRLISSELFGVAPWDGVLLGACVALFVLATLAAAAIPAWRAGRVTPMHALRAE
jgi:predicted permease